MPNIASAIKEEVRRLSRKEIRTAVEPLKKANTLQRRQIADLKDKLGVLERALRSARRNEAPGASSPGEDGPRQRFAARGVIAHRRKTGLSAEAYGALLGVSGQTIYKWERGEARPRAKQVALWLDLRALGKREIDVLVAALPESKKQRGE